uniref:Uncharacterized protein n=1 Tax=Rhizophora mucronata TaxID=61149 RepID=A0A2P2QPB4_RHIMU
MTNKRLEVEAQAFCRSNPTDLFPTDTQGRVKNGRNQGNKSCISRSICITPQITIFHASSSNNFLSDASHFHAMRFFSDKHDRRGRTKGKKKE